MITLEKHTEEITLIHITTESSVNSIRENGITASEYGDLEVNGNDGFGVYAIRSLEAHKDLIQELSLNQEQLYAVEFKPCGDWYECIDETEPEDDIEDDSFVPYHIGYVVCPYDIPKENITKIYKIS